MGSSETENGKQWLYVCGSKLCCEERVKDDDSPQFASPRFLSVESTFVHFFRFSHEK